MSLSLAQTSSLQFAPDMTLQVSYDTVLQKVKYTVTVPNGQYFAIGYGWSMKNTDMVSWHASGNASNQKDLWSTSNEEDPQPDQVNTY